MSADGHESRGAGVDRLSYRAVIDGVLADRRDAALERRSDDDGPAPTADRSAAERLLARNARALARVLDPRQRRQRAYALLARHGFDPETCREVAATAGSEATTGEPEDSEDP